jgi:hypothetical protein
MKTYKFTDPKRLVYIHVRAHSLGEAMQMAPVNFRYNLLTITK